MKRSTQIQADLAVKGCRARLYLNDIPVMNLGPTGTVVQRVAAEQLLIPGRNRLELLVEPGVTPSTARSGRQILTAKDLGPEPRAVASLVRFKLDVRPGAMDVEPSIEPPEEIAAVSWQWPSLSLDDSSGAVAFPETHATELDLGAGLGRWRWQDAPILELDDGLRAEANEFLDEFSEAFRAARYDVLWELSRQQNEDIQVCYPGLTEEFLRSDLARVVEFYRRSLDPIVPRDPEDADYHLVGRGRLLHVVCGDYSAAFKLRDPDDGSAVDVSMFLARVNGELRIVR